MAKRNDRRLIAWETHSQSDMAIEPASTDRDWMEQTDRRFAYRCLPLVIANQAGWIIRNPIRFSVRWNGGPARSDLRIRFPRGRRETRICSHFGHGVLTFGIPYLFRTPHGVNLWVKGPANVIKDGIQPLEGIVETDWTAATFTMNWKLTRADQSVRFECGEPICMIVPVRRGLVETLEPVRAPLHQNKKLMRAYEHWCRSRTAFNEAIGRLDEQAVQRGWQRDYMLGLDPAGVPFAEHQARLRLREFKHKR